MAGTCCSWQATGVCSVYNDRRGPATITPHLVSPCDIMTIHPHLPFLSCFSISPAQPTPTMEVDDENPLLTKVAGGDLIDR